VATLRTGRFKVGQVVDVLECGRHHRGYAEVVEVREASWRNVETYWRLSGFNSPEEWWDQALKLHGRRPRVIVFLQLL